MMYAKAICRFLHLHRTCTAAEKSHLATLRKKTGYTFANCKKALELHDNDLSQAEKWLKQQAQALGWSKATKLEGRQTTQGLIAVAINDRNAALVEVNCETDFVARNNEFQKIVNEAATSCLNFTQRQPDAKGPITKVCLDAEQLKNLQASDGKSLADHLALMIGTVGENASLRRALCFKAENGVRLAGYAHPSGGENNNVLLGRVAGLVALKSFASNDGDVDKISKELCQHIVGMNPQRVGDLKDKPAKDKEDEVCLIHQEFLLDDSVTVKEILDEYQLEVVDFRRFECGENALPTEQTESCQ